MDRAAYSLNFSSPLLAGFWESVGGKKVVLNISLEWQTHLHLCLFHVGVDHGCHIAEGSFPRFSVEQNTVQDLEQLLLKVRQSGKRQKGTHLKQSSTLSHKGEKCREEREGREEETILPF